MKYIRLFCNFLVLSSTTMVLLFTANYKFTDTIPETALNIFLQIMHLSLFFAVLFNVWKQWKKREIVKLILTLLPAAVMAAYVICLSFDYRAPGFTLLIFDFYLIYYFFYLSLEEIRAIKKNL